MSNSQNNTAKLVVSMAEAGHALDSGHDQIYRLIKAGELNSFLVGTRRKVTMESIERLIAKRIAASGTFTRCHQSPPVPRRKRKKA